MSDLINLRLEMWDWGLYDGWGRSDLKEQRTSGDLQGMRRLWEGKVLYLWKSRFWWFKKIRS